MKHNATSLPPFSHGIVQMADKWGAAGREPLYPFAETQQAASRLANGQRPMKASG
jgi:hypothetical protein